MVSFETIALRERPEDIEPLAVHFLEALSIENGFPRKRLSRAAISALKSYAWPGNVRELQNVLERAAIFAADEEIGADALLRDNEPAYSPSPSGKPYTEPPRFGTHPGRV